MSEPLKQQEQLDVLATMLANAPHFETYVQGLHRELRKGPYRDDPEFFAAALGAALAVANQVEDAETAKIYGAHDPSGVEAGEQLHNVETIHREFLKSYRPLPKIVVQAHAEAIKRALKDLGYDVHWGRTS